MPLCMLAGVYVREVVEYACGNTAPSFLSQNLQLLREKYDQNFAIAKNFFITVCS